jgi:peptide-methionine (R)-S-oxide reductase
MDSNKKENSVYSGTDTGKVDIPNDEWKKILPSNVYNIAREKGTEKPFTGKYWDSKEIGTYHCAACVPKLTKERSNSTNNKD